MKNDFDDLEQFERKETSHNLPKGWVILFFGLILWGVYYLIAYTPAISGWSQEKAYLESVEADGTQAKKEVVIEDTNPLAESADALSKGKTIYASNCGACHGEAGEGGIGPSLKDAKWLDRETQVSDKTIYLIIADGTQQGMEIEGLKAAGGMPPFSGTLNKDKIWSLVTFIRGLK